MRQRGDGSVQEEEQKALMYNQGLECGGLIQDGTCGTCGTFG